jgi:hypothetical protein
LSTIVSKGSREEDAEKHEQVGERGGVVEEVEGEERETAAEKRRRMAALGVSQEREESESDNDDDENHPSVQQSRPRETMIPEPKPRVQWGGVHGRETAAAMKANEEAGKEEVAGSEEGTAKKGIKGLFGKKH